jgi:hypothetical protein
MPKDSSIIYQKEVAHPLQIGNIQEYEEFSPEGDLDLTNQRSYEINMNGPTRKANPSKQIAGN